MDEAFAVAPSRASQIRGQTQRQRGWKPYSRHAPETECIDKGYRGHDAPKPDRVFKSGRKRGVHGQIKKELRRRSANEPVIGHCKAAGHLGRNFLHRRLGDRINAVMSAVGYNLRPSPGLRGATGATVPPQPQVVEETLAPNHRRNIERDSPVLNAQTGFSTTDQLKPG